MGNEKMLAETCDIRHLHNDYSKEEIIESVDVLFDKNDMDKRIETLSGIAESYFTHFGIEFPDSLINEGIKPLLDPNATKRAIKECLADLKRVAREYHRDKTPRVEIKKDVTKTTLLKIIKRTWFGTRIEEMGVDNSTKDNIHQGFITKPVHELIVDKVLVPNKRTNEIERSVIIAFKREGEQDIQVINRINFIREQLKKPTL